MKTARQAEDDPVPVVVTKAVMALMRASDVARREMVQSLQPHAITLQQFNVLIILRHAGREGLPTLEVAARLIEQTPGITRLINTLVAKRCIRRRRPKDDRRQQFCYLTDRGIQLIDTVLPLVRASQARVVRQLKETQLEHLVQLLGGITNQQA